MNKCTELKRQVGLSIDLDQLLHLEYTHPSSVGLPVFANEVQSCIIWNARRRSSASKGSLIVMFESKKEVVVEPLKTKPTSLPWAVEGRCV